MSTAFHVTLAYHCGWCNAITIKSPIVRPIILMELTYPYKFYRPKATRVMHRFADLFPASCLGTIHITAKCMQCSLIVLATFDDAAPGGNFVLTLHVNVSRDTGFSCRVLHMRIFGDYGTLAKTCCVKMAENDDVNVIDTPAQAAETVRIRRAVVPPELIFEREPRLQCPVSKDQIEECWDDCLGDIRFCCARIGETTAKCILYPFSAFLDLAGTCCCYCYSK